LLAGDVISKLKSQIILLAEGIYFGQETNPTLSTKNEKFFRKKSKNIAGKCPEACQRTCQQSK